MKNENGRGRGPSRSDGPANGQGLLFCDCKKRAFLKKPQNAYFLVPFDDYLFLVMIGRN
jgi:hypothetical protein